MKKLIFLLLLLPLTGIAQTVTIQAGTDGYVTINGQNYNRNNLQTVYTYRTHDSTVAILYNLDRKVIITATIDSNYIYVDSTNAKARNMVVLRTWMNTNLEHKN